MAKRRDKTGKTSDLDAPKPVIRCDLLPHRMNKGKETAVLSMLTQWRCMAASVSRIQWRLFQETGRFYAQHDEATSFRKGFAKVRLGILEKIVDHYGIERRAPLQEGEKLPKRALPTPLGLVDPLAKAKESLGAAPIQMIRAQVVGMLESFVSNRQNDFVAIVMRSNLNEVVRHMLFAVNATRNWFNLDKQVKIEREGSYILVPHDIRLLARAIWRRVMSLHRKPSMKHIGMVLDQRAVTLLPAHSSEAFPLWLRLRFFGRARPIEIPLQSYPYFEQRLGDRKLTVQVSQDRETKRLGFGILTDIGAVCEAQQIAYKKTVMTKIVPLDFGLTTLFATDQGDLLGRGFLKKLKALDATLIGISRHFRRSNPRGKLRDSKRYRHHVQRMRGFIDTEIGRVLNRLVETMRPGELVLEGLNFDVLVRRHVERWPSARADDRTGRPGAPADPRLGNPYFKDHPPKARSPAANANSPRKQMAA